MNYPNGCSCSTCKNKTITGNSIDINLAQCEIAEIRADVIVESAEANVVRLWGQIRDCNNETVPQALLKLVKVVCTPTGSRYEGIAHTISDCEGFYQFDLCNCHGNECYKVLVGKSYTGPEKVIQTSGGNCGACQGNDCNCYSCPPQPCPPQPCPPQPCPPQPCPPQPCPPQPCPPQPCPPQPYPPQPYPPQPCPPQPCPPQPCSSRPCPSRPCPPQPCPSHSNCQCQMSSSGPGYY